MVHIFCWAFLISLGRYGIWSSGIVMAINLAVARLSCGAYFTLRSSKISVILLGYVLRFALVPISCIRSGDLPLLSKVVVI